MNAEAFGKAFDNGGYVSKYLSFSKAPRPGREQSESTLIFPSRTA